MIPTTGYAQSWAQRPISQGGLSASYISTAEFGEQYNDSIDGQHQRGVNFGLAFYDCLVNPPNQAPVVNAGADQAITAPAISVTLAGSVSDDGLPAGATVTSTWTVTSGTGAVTFGNAPSPSTTATFSTTGVYVLRLTATDTALSAYDECTISVNGTTGGGQPYGGTPWPVPGTIQAENYDLGGQSVAYNDTTPDVNTGGGYRPNEGVDIRAVVDDPNAFIIKDIFPGEWLNYTVSIAQAGTYTFTVCTAGTDSGNYLHVNLDGSAITNSIVLNTATDWDHGVTTSTTCVLPAGIHVMQLYFDTGDFNLDWFQLTLGNNQPPKVSAGANKSVAMPNAVTLSGTVSDDGQPAGAR